MIVGLGGDMLCWCSVESYLSCVVVKHAKVNS